MAALTNLTNISTSISPNAEQPFGFGGSGLIIEFFRVALGTVGDTIAVTPRWITKIVAAQGAGLPATNDLSAAATATNTNVTFTLTASGATNVNVDFQLIGRR